jgi:hypothetical protein
MPDTRKKTPTSSLIERIENEANAVLAGHRVPLSVPQGRELAGHVLYLLKANRHLIMSNDQLARLRSEALKDLLACQLQLQLLDKEAQAVWAVLELLPELLAPRKHNPWDNSSVPRR